MAWRDMPEPGSRPATPPGRRDRQERALVAAALLILVLGLAQATRPIISDVNLEPAVAEGPVSAGTSSTSPGAPPAARRAVPTTARHPTVPGRAPLARAPKTTAAPRAVAGAVVGSTLTAPPPEPPRSAAVAQGDGPGGYGCPAALAYLAAHQAPGFADVCAPGSAGPGAAGLTVAVRQGGTATGTIYIACPAPIVYMNEASNSLRFSGLSSAPFDPYGGVPWRECRPGDIAPAS